MKTKDVPRDDDHQLVKDGYAEMIGKLPMLFSDHLIAGLLTRLRARAAGNPDAFRNPATVGSASYDAFDYGADRADKWWESLTEYLRGQYRLGIN